MWFKVDDKFHSHEKTIGLTLGAVGLWTLAGAWSADYQRDGFVPSKFVVSKNATGEAAELVEAGLWDEVEGGWQFHDWDAYQPTREEVEERREGVSSKRAEAGRRGAEARWHGKAMANAWQADGKAMANAWQADGKAMANAWQADGKAMANAWQADGKAMANAWQADGKAMANAWQADGKAMANAWQADGKAMANAWQADGKAMANDSPGPGPGPEPEPVVVTSSCLSSPSTRAKDDDRPKNNEPDGYNVYAIQRTVREHCGLDIDVFTANRLAGEIITKAREPVKRPTAYLQTAITNNPDEIRATLKEVTA